MKTIHLRPISAFTDNYIWMLDDGQHAVVVDPGQAEPVLSLLHELDLSLKSIVVTHHHGDHTAGVCAIKQQTGAQVFGPAHESVDCVDVPLEGGGALMLLDLPCQVMDVPGHTAGHIAFYLPKVNLACGAAPVLFCGDTLFSGGCGRLFEGTPEQMLHSLDRLAALPDNTWICAAHEYTLSNLQFASVVEPSNKGIQAAIVKTQELRREGLPSLPSTLQRERDINPFLRSRLPKLRRSVQEHTQQPLSSDAEWFGALRAWKDQF